MTCRGQMLQRYSRDLSSFEMRLSSEMERAAGSERRNRQLTRTIETNAAEVNELRSEVFMVCVFLDVCCVCI